MAKFKFTLFETYSKEVEVEADTRDKAFEKLDVMVYNGDENAVDLGDKIGGYEYNIVNA